MTVAELLTEHLIHLRQSERMNRDRASTLSAEADRLAAAADRAGLEIGGIVAAMHRLGIEVPCEAPEIDGRAPLPIEAR